jgi:hypothetical protein
MGAKPSPLDNRTKNGNAYINQKSNKMLDEPEIR